MATWWQDVYSSAVSQIGYDDENKDLLVKWSKGGKTSAYNGVSEATALDVSKAPSVNGMIISDIKPNYPHRYV